jgi:hypothetical protein
VREFSTDRRALGARFLGLDAGSMMDDAEDLGVRSELILSCRSLGFLPLRMSFNLSGSSSKSTKFFGASTCSVVTPETTRNLAVTLKVGGRADDRAQAETGGEFELGILDMRGRFLGFGDLFFSRSPGTKPIASGGGVDSR